jgi:hypothetical protein
MALTGFRRESKEKYNEMLKKLKTAKWTGKLKRNGFLF